MTKKCKLIRGYPGLFITEDGVEIYCEEYFYYVDNNYVINTVNVNSFINYISFIRRIFSTKKAAQEFVEENKPKYSKKMIEDTIDKLFSKEIREDESGSLIKKGYTDAFFKELDKIK